MCKKTILFELTFKKQSNKKWKNSYFSFLGFFCKYEQPLRGMELQVKEAQKY